MVQYRTIPLPYRVAASTMLAVMMMMATTVVAAASPKEMLLNRSFEEPIVPMGDNFLGTLPDWTVTADHPGTPDGASINIVRPHGDYATGASTPPVDGGSQYLDIVNSHGLIRQVVVLPEDGTIELGAWFSQRDRPHRLDGVGLRLLDQGGIIVAEAYTSFDGSEPLGAWKRAERSGVRVAAGSYTVEIDLSDSASVDLASLSYAPGSPGRLVLTKSVRTLADPVNRLSDPKAIPGATMGYTIEVENVGDKAIDADTQILQDATPPHLAFMSSDRFTIVFDASDSGLKLRYGGRSDTTDDVEFSSDGGSTWTHAPTGASDPAVTNVRFRPKGAMKPHSRYRIEIPYVIL